MIDNYWLDKSLYNVGFLVEYSYFYNKKEITKYRKSCKMLVLSMGLSEIEVQEIVLTNFENVIEVLFVDELEDVLLLR